MFNTITQDVITIVIAENVKVNAMYTNMNYSMSSI